MNIGEEVRALTEKYETRDPFDITAAMQIPVLYETLGSINGYYNRPYGVPIIHINQDLVEHDQQFVCAHELGHCILHPDANTPFLRSSTYMSVDRIEIQANVFAMYLLISDAELAESRYYTVDQVARFFGYQRELIELRLKEW